MQHVLQLAEPVEFGDIRLAPTSELAGLAELSRLRDHDSMLDAVVRIAATIKAEDDERQRVAALRAASDAVALPRRR
ncbi:hypothetical protein [Rhabdothermincola sediminis]|uniref:hypothetical protein n=1 Tax=Rhabdothermincola sediminis TaxID=2751370 RepID=UPI001AA0B136|nr:hypothetical protein [Rhabdothermincola sediminis]